MKFEKSCSVELVIHDFFLTFQQIGQRVIPTSTRNTSVRTVIIVRLYRRVVAHHTQHYVLAQNITTIRLSVRTFTVSIHRCTGFNEIIDGLIDIYTSGNTVKIRILQYTFLFIISQAGQNFCLFRTATELNVMILHQCEPCTNIQPVGIYRRL